MKATRANEGPGAWTRTSAPKQVTVQGERGSLHQRLHAHEFFARLEDRQSDGACARGVGLVAVHAHGLGMDQQHGMTLRRQLTGPVVSSAAGFDADQERRMVRRLP